MANYMKEIAGLLGVELGESFKIVDNNSGKYHNYYRLTEEKGIEVSDDNANWEMAIAGVLKWLLMGDARIIKLPWKPAKYNSYYYPCLDYEDLWGCSTWDDTQIDKDRLKHGIIFKTKEEAIVFAQRMLVVVKEAREDG